MDNKDVITVVLLITKIINENKEKIKLEPEYAWYYEKENKDYLNIKNEILNLFSIDLNTSEEDISNQIDKVYISNKMIIKLNEIRKESAFIKFLGLISLNTIERQFRIDANSILDQYISKNISEVYEEFEIMDKEIDIKGLNREIGISQCYKYKKMLHDIRNYIVSIIEGKQIPKVTYLEWQKLTNQNGRN